MQEGNVKSLFLIYLYCSVPLLYWTVHRTHKRKKKALEQNVTKVKKKKNPIFPAPLLIITAVLPTSLKTEMSRCPTLHPKSPVSHQTYRAICAMFVFSSVCIS